MFQPASFFIGLRYSRGKSLSGFVSFITFFSTAGILLGVASLITVVSVMNGFESELKNRILGIVPHVIVSGEANEQNIAQIRQHEMVKQVTPFVELEGLVQSNTQLQGVLIHGIQAQHHKNTLLGQNIIAGQLTDLEQQPYSAALGRSLAKKLSVRVGDTIRLVLPAKTIFTPMGRLPAQRTFTVAAIFNIGSQVDVVYVAQQNANKLARVKSSEVNQRIYLSDAFLAPELVADWQQQYPDITYTTWTDTQGALFSAVRMEKNMMWLMLSLIIAVAAFNIVSALVLVVNDKQGEIGILRTLGMPSAGIMKIFITQGLVNGTWGTSLGLILGLLLTYGLNPILSLLNINMFGSGYATQQLPIVVQWQDIVIIAVSAFLMTILATLYPAYKAAQTQPAEVLRNE